MDRATAVARGWFGPVSAGVLPRLGDVVVASRGDTAIMSSADFPYEMTLVGLHGSLTPDEMLIPMHRQLTRLDLRPRARWVQPAGRDQPEVSRREGAPGPGTRPWRGPR